MTRFARPNDSVEHEAVELPTCSWVAFLQYFTGRVDEVDRVTKSGGLHDPDIAAHLRASRIHGLQPSRADHV